MKKKVAILVDSSSLILTYSAGLLSNVIRWYDVLLPNSVYEEITTFDKPGAEHFQDLGVGGSVQVISCPGYPHSLEEKQKQDLYRMGRGERDVLIYVLTGLGSFAVVDDLLAARFCVRYKVPFINGLLLPRILHWSGVISSEELGSSLSYLEKHGRYSSDILKRARSFKAMELEQFFPEK